MLFINFGCSVNHINIPRKVFLNKPQIFQNHMKVMLIMCKILGKKWFCEINCWTIQS